MNDELRATLIIVSKNRVNGLRRCLTHIVDLGSVAANIILVDNGSTDETYAEMIAFKNCTSSEVRVLKTLRPGNSAGRNDAIRDSDSEVLIFIDDDCYVRPGFIRAWLSVFRENPCIGFASGSILPESPHQSMLGCNPVSERKIYRSRAFFPRGAIQGSNMAFRRKCLDQVGFFDERFGAGTKWAGEEWDLAIRVSNAGWCGGLFPEPVVAHDHGRSDSDAAKRLKFYDFGAGAVYAKHMFSGLRNYWPYLMKDFWVNMGSPRAILNILGGLSSYVIRSIRMMFKKSIEAPLGR